MLLSVTNPWRRAGHALGLLALLVMTAVGEQAQAAPQTFNTALPVAKGEFIFRQQFLYKRASDDPSAANRKMEVLGGISVLAYGVTGDLAIFGVLPYRDKQLSVTTGGERATRRTLGIGDAQLFGRQTIFKNNFPGGSFRVAPFAGIELPTGDDNDRDSLGTLPATLQLGSGSWDPFAGVVATYQTLDFQIDVSAGYKVNTEANNFEFGDEARFDASLQTRLWPRKLGGGVPGFLYGVIEANLIHTAKNETNGTTDGNSGGITLFIAPGLQYVTKRWILEAIVQIPAFQNLNGSALGDDFNLRAGLRMNF